MPRNDLISEVGKTYGRWTVIRFSHKTPPYRIFWLCRCTCGAEKTVVQDNLRAGSARSCGCLHKELVTKHGQHDSPTYSCWERMIQRCNNPNEAAFGNYGGRGISVCERWGSFENFLADMGERPTSKHSIDRIDNNGNYEKANCRWATRSQQDRNLRRNVWVTHEGRTMILADWAKEAGVPQQVLRGRLNQCNWSFSDAISTPVGKYSKKLVAP
jgi:hypothetical protein